MKYVRTDSGTLLSEAISFSRFPMIAGIVVLHSSLLLGFADEVTPRAGQVMYFCSNILARICVPLFFVISGFLFFYRGNRFDLAFYAGKWRKRLHTLVLPYLLWNLIAFLVLMLKKLPVLSGFFPGIAGEVITPWRFLASFWSFEYTGVPTDGTGNPLFYFEPPSAPIDFPLWFVRDLMVLAVLAPLLCYIIRKVRWAAVIVLSVCFLGNWCKTMVPGLSISGLLFFTLGATLAVERINPAAWLWSRGTRRGTAVTAGLTAAYAGCAVAELLTVGEAVNPHLHALSIMVGLPWLFSLFCMAVRGGRRINGMLTASAFFIFAFHGIVCGNLRQIAVQLLYPATTGGWLAAYLFTILSTLALSVALYLLCRRFLPRLTKILCGSRL